MNDFFEDANHPDFDIAILEGFIHCINDFCIKKNDANIFVMYIVMVQLCIFTFNNICMERDEEI